MSCFQLHDQMHKGRACLISIKEWGCVSSYHVHAVGFSTLQLFVCVVLGLCLSILFSVTFIFLSLLKPWKIVYTSSLFSGSTHSGEELGSWQGQGQPRSCPFCLHGLSCRYNSLFYFSFICNTDSSVQWHRLWAERWPIPSSLTGLLCIFNEFEFCIIAWNLKWMQFMVTLVSFLYLYQIFYILYVIFQVPVATFIGSVLYIVHNIVIKIIQITESKLLRSVISRRKCVIFVFTLFWLIITNVDLCKLGK